MTGAASPRLETPGLRRGGPGDPCLRQERLARRVKNNVWPRPATSGHSQRLPLRATGSAYAGPTTRDVRFRSVNPAPKWPRQPSRFDRVCFDGGQLWHDSTARTGGLRATLARYLTDAQEKNADIQVCALPMSDCILNLLEQSHTIDQLVDRWLEPVINSSTNCWALRFEGAAGGGGGGGRSGRGGRRCV